MQFNSIKNSSFSGLAKSVNRATDTVFKAARDSAVDNTKIANEAIKGRSTERRAAMKAEADVAKAGFLASKKVYMTEKDIETDKAIRDIKRPAKRMAGIVGGLGALAGGFVSMEQGKKDKAERDELRAYRDELDRKADERARKSDERRAAYIDSLKTGTDNTETDDPKPKAPVSAGTGDNTEIASSTPVARSLSPGSSSSPTFKSVVDMATKSGAKYPQLVAAQWALESGWGKTPSGKNNFFGIKATSNEAGTSKQTWEVENGKEVTTSARFKDFETPQAAVDDLVSKWHRDYKSYRGVNNASDAFSAADMLRQQGYATDPNYSKKLKDILRSQGY